MKTTTAEISYYFEKLFPITRSLTGNGNRQSLEIVKEIIPLNVKEYKSGTKVFDWEIPQEWNIKDGWIKNAKGEKIIDFSKTNIHVVGYSESIHAKIKFEDLKSHLHYLEKNPEIIPFNISYYNRYWGFSLSYYDYKLNFKEGEEYEVFIDSELKNGSLTLADFIVKGETETEYLFSTYFCHPSMANDNLSGFLLCALLAREIKDRKLKNTYRFFFGPETIGAITYCAMNKESIRRMSGGYVLSCVAGKGKFGYKKSFSDNHLVDRAAIKTLKDRGDEFVLYPFVPQGSDERQYSSPGFRIPVGSVHKDKYHEYDEYHTSADNLDFVKSEYLLQSLEIYLSIIDKLENQQTFTSLYPDCEPRLGAKGLYPMLGRRTMGSETLKKNAEENKLDLDKIMWLLFYADGKQTVFDIAEKHDMDFKETLAAAKLLEQKGLIKFNN